MIDSVWQNINWRHSLLSYNNALYEIENLEHISAESQSPTSLFYSIM